MARAIMIQGTASDAGKSLICTGLCRIFRQDGYRTAPFKSQNMASDSFTTVEGLAMARAQALQAQAAGLEPSVLMNPILLQPTGEAVSRVIVQGRPVKTMSAAAYLGCKEQLRTMILESYRKLAEQYEIIVLEGAGSPAEINLKDDDIVNMGMAAMAAAPVLLVGDIDRGGVFAAIYGTLALLEQDERERIRGVVINRFRGDLEILRPGLAMLEELIELPVLGVVPQLPLDLDSGNSSPVHREAQFDALAAALRENLDLEQIYRFLGERPLHGQEQGP